MIPVVISTREGREAWVEDLWQSIKETTVVPRQERTIIGWEIEAIKDAYLYTDWPEFLFLQDSTRVKDPRFWSYLDSLSGTSQLLMPRPNCYMGLYQREVLDKVFNEFRSDYHWNIDNTLPFAEQKEWALAYEDWFIREYVLAATGRTVDQGSDLPAIFPQMTDANSPKRETIHGELRMVMENDYFIKYKGTFR